MRTWVQRTAVTVIVGGLAASVLVVSNGAVRGESALFSGRLERVALAASSTKTLPEKMKRTHTGDGTQLITAVAKGTKNSSRDGTLTWWQRQGKTWVKVGSAKARFGVHGLSDYRLEGDGTTPTGYFRLPSAFGIDAAPSSTKLPWHSVDSGSWWDENSLDAHYNTWYENCPATVCWESATSPAHSSEHLADYTPQYEYAVFIGFNADKTRVTAPAKPSGSGIFLHVNGKGYTAGCISVSKPAMVALLKWLDPARTPRIAIGNAKSIYRF